MSAKSVSLFFPVYNDEGTVRVVAEKALALLHSLDVEHEIIIINDGSRDRSAEIARQLAAENPCIKLIDHPINLGYGAAVRSGFAASQYDCICLTDGDNQYEVEDFRRLLRLVDRYDLIVTFRYKKIYSGLRIFISWVYNLILRIMFRTPFRDISTGLRLVRKEVIADVSLESNSPFIGAELAIKAMLKGYRVGEVGIQTFPRDFGDGSSTSVRNILATMRDLWYINRSIFSDSYDLPHNRSRDSVPPHTPD